MVKAKLKFISLKFRSDRLTPQLMPKRRYKFKSIFFLALSNQLLELVTRLSRLRLFQNNVDNCYIYQILLYLLIFLRQHTIIFTSLLFRTKIIYYPVIELYVNVFFLLPSLY